jgi:MoxR-like ATPase
MQHRIGLPYEAEAEDVTQADIVKKIMEQVQVP